MTHINAVTFFDKGFQDNKHAYALKISTDKKITNFKNN